ncbi:helix-turn-helix domain-containing protein [Sphingomonas sp. 8AM]|uniref:helix-turn-helix domain-containing protein n=1 Tax=Sphingomonas sp. 8AM TaxID=2653170 RepID=UPI001359E2D6
MARLHSAGQSVRPVAAALHRQPPVVSRELKRTTSAVAGHCEARLARPEDA